MFAVGHSRATTPLFGYATFASPTTARPLGGLDADYQRQADAITTLTRQFREAAESGQAVSTLSVLATRLVLAAAPIVSTDSDSVLSARTVNSSDRVSSSVQAEAAIQSRQVRVSQLARGPQLTSTPLADQGTTKVAAGTHAFELVTNDQHVGLQVDVQAGDTNRQVFEKMAAAINEAGRNVTAQVDTDPRQNVQLVVTGNLGATEPILLQDQSGSVVAVTGANATYKASQQALVTVDGVEYASDDNTLSLDHGHLFLRLKALTTDPDSERVTVSAAADTVANAVEAFTRAVNSYQNNRRSSADMLNRVTDLSPIFRSVDLQALGISLHEEDQTLTVDRAKLMDGLQKDYSASREALVGPRGIASQISQRAEFLLDQPASNLARGLVDTSIVSNSLQRTFASSLTGMFLNVRV